jgi:hypothetical protein
MALAPLNIMVPAQAEETASDSGRCFSVNLGLAGGGIYNIEGYGCENCWAPGDGRLPGSVTTRNPLEGHTYWVTYNSNVCGPI